MPVPYRTGQRTTKMLVAYRQHREQRDASSLQDRTENHKMLVPYRTGQRTTKCKLLTDKHREQRDASSLQRGNNVFAYGQHREQRDASSLHREATICFGLQTTQRTTKRQVPDRAGQRAAEGCLLTDNTENNEMPVPYREATSFFLLTDNTENNKVLVHYRTGQRATRC